MTVEEPEWTLDDLRAALDWQAEQDLLCQCGSPRDETMVHEDDAPIYDVTALVCWRCRASGMAAQDAAQANGGSVPPGRYFTAVRR